MLSQTVIQMGFWLTWMIIPLLFEGIPTIINVGRILFRSRKHDWELPSFLPQLSIIIPTYNSAKTLYHCLASIQNSDYPTNKISVIVVDNGSTDSTFQTFAAAQKDLRGLKLSWMTTSRGKAVAMNAAIYQSHGDFIINLDSDGWLDKHALSNLIRQFYAHPDVGALTGTILTNRKSITKKESWHRRLLQLCEYAEYCQAFLAGRNIESVNDQLFTMSGAFSAFRRVTLMQTTLYNPQIICEDTDITFQIRYQLKGKAELCDTALFYTEPISDFNHLYAQRQRWQRGELEVISQYLADDISLRGFFHNFQVRRLIVDHTVALLKTLWLFATFILIGFGYSWLSMLLSFGLLYLLYLLINILNSFCVYVYLRPFPQERRFYIHRLWLILIQPFYNLICSFIRCIGIINSTTSSTTWRGTSLTAEMKHARQVVANDYHHVKENKHYDD
jgi:biofilm PGA synthesis N-glycosyltransferase PgaC